MSGGTQAPRAITVRVTRRFDVSSERIFDAWLDPRLIGRWMFGPALREEEVLHLETDPRVGGKFSFLVRRQGVEIDHVGTYLTIDRPRALTFTWGIAGESAEESEVRIAIAPHGAGCELTLIHELSPKWADYENRIQAGWTKMLGAMASAIT